MNKTVILIVPIIIYGCSTLKQSPKYELGDDYYNFKQQGSKSENVLVLVQGDSLELFRHSTSTQLRPDMNTNLYFTKPSLDVDLMTVPFKFRRQTLNLPSQLNTDFNGNVYFGYRVDRFKIKPVSTPIGKKKHIGHRGLTLGGFAGIGSTAVTPWTTNNFSSDEYYGCVLTGGLAVMIAFHNHTAGIGIGWDRLTGRDRQIWIYQYQPWYGFTVGININ